MSFLLITLQGQLLVLVGGRGGSGTIPEVGFLGDAGDIDAHGRLLGHCQRWAVCLGSMVLLNCVHVKVLLQRGVVVQSAWWVDATLVLVLSAIFVAATSISTSFLTGRVVGLPLTEARNAKRVILCMLAFQQKMLKISVCLLFALLTCKSVLARISFDDATFKCLLFSFIHTLDARLWHHRCFNGRLFELLGAFSHKNIWLWDSLW